MWEGTPNYHINGLQAAAGAAATVAGKRVGKMQKSAQQQRQQQQQWHLHSQLPEGACSGIRQLEVATRQAGNEAATKRFSNLPNGNHFLIIVAASCNIIIIAIKPHFSSHALPPLLSPPLPTRPRLCCNSAD